MYIIGVVACYYMYLSEKCLGLFWAHSKYSPKTRSWKSQFIKNYTKVILISRVQQTREDARALA